MMHTRPTFLTICLLGFFLLSCPSAVMAAEGIGTIIGVQGTATARNDSGERSLEMTAQVFVHDTVITGPDSKLQILFTDDTILAQGPDSESSLADYAYLDGGEEDSRFLLDMAEGTFRVITGKIVEDNPDDGFRMQTPLAVIGIRGTMTGHMVHNGQEHHFSLDLHGDHTVNINARFDGTTGVLQGDFQALDIVPGMPMGHVRDMTPEEQQFMSQLTGITEFNPTPGAVLSGQPGTDGIAPNVVGAIVYGDGTILHSDGTIINPDGTVVNPDGAVINPDGSVLYADGTVINPDGTITRPDGVVSMPDSVFLAGDGIIPSGDGLLPGADPVLNDPLVDPLLDPLAPGTGTVINDLTSGGLPGIIVGTDSVKMHAAEGFFVINSLADIPPYLMKFEPEASIYNVQGEGVTDTMRINETLGKITALGVNGISQASLLSEMPVGITYTNLGSTTDAQWGYWSATNDVYYSPNFYDMIKMYEVSVDVPTIARPDLAGTYDGPASGIMYVGTTPYLSSSGNFNADITDITSGTVTFGIDVEFPFPSPVLPESYTANGVGSINNGTFDLLVTGTNLYIPGAATGGSSDIFGAVGKDGSMAGTFHFWSDDMDTIGVGEFHGTHN